MMMTITVRNCYLFTLNTNTLLPITSLNINMVKESPYTNNPNICVPNIFS